MWKEPVDFLWTKIAKLKMSPVTMTSGVDRMLKIQELKKVVFFVFFVVVLSCFVFVLSLGRLDDWKLSLVRLYLLSTFSHVLRFGLVVCYCHTLQRGIDNWAAMFRLKKKKKRIQRFSIFALSHEAMVSECCPLWTCVYFLFSPPSLTSLWLHSLQLSYLFQRGIG